MEYPWKQIYLKVVWTPRNGRLEHVCEKKPVPCGGGFVAQPPLFAKIVNKLWKRDADRWNKGDVVSKIIVSLSLMLLLQLVFRNSTLQYRILIKLSHLRGCWNSSPVLIRSRRVGISGITSFSSVTNEVSITPPLEIPILQDIIIFEIIWTNCMGWISISKV